MLAWLNTRVHCIPLRAPPTCNTDQWSAPARPPEPRQSQATTAPTPSRAFPSCRPQATAAPTPSPSLPSASALLPLPFSHAKVQCRSQSRMWPDIWVELVDEVARADEPEDVVAAPVCVAPYESPKLSCAPVVRVCAGDDVVVAAGPRAPEVEAARVLVAEAMAPTSS